MNDTPKHTCTQTERILTLELTTKQMADNISEIKSEVKEINNKFDLMLEKLESKFAAKWTETAIKWFIVLVMTIVLSAIIYEVVKK